MEMNKKIFLVGLLITSILFISILFFNSLANNQREKAVLDRMNDVVGEYENMQTLIFMSEIFGEDSTCVGLQSTLLTMDKGLWDLGLKIDLYRQVTENFMQDPFYVQQKTEFNRKEVLYFAMLKRMKDMCRLNQTIISYFYKRKEACPDCDAQSFVLADIKRDLEKMNREDEIAIFSFDADLDIASINLLTRVYNITSYPSIVLGNITYSGLHNKKETISLFCREKKMAIC